MGTWRLEFPPGTPLINVNGREHWRARAKVTASLRAAACALALGKGIPPLGKVRITAIYYPPDRRRRDSSNFLYLSTKAAIDGITDAKVLEDDNDSVVTALILKPARDEDNQPVIVKKGQMILEVEEV